MKDIFNVICLIFLIILITVICCFMFIPNVSNFNETGLYKYIENNKDNVDQVIVRTVTLLGENCYKINTLDGYNILYNISFKKKTNMTCTDSDMYIEFYFKNNEKRILSFECGNMHYRDEKYDLENEVILYNKDQYVPDKINNGMIIVFDSNKVECR